jgi:cytochrome b6-f complex iron-sulfur subunit
VAYSSQDSQENNDPGRRGFIKFLLGFSVIATLGGVLTPIIGYLWPPSRESSAQGGRVRVASLADLQAAGGLVIPVEGEAIVLTYSDQAGVRAFSAVCPHLGCVCRWEEAGGYIQCPCHDARFNAQTGAVISGPSPAPLPLYDVAVEGDDIYVALT